MAEATGTRRRPAAGARAPRPDRRGERRRDDEGRPRAPSSATIRRRRGAFRKVLEAEPEPLRRDLPASPRVDAAGKRSERARCGEGARDGRTVRRSGRPPRRASDCGSSPSSDTSASPLEPRHDVEPSPKPPRLASLARLAVACPAASVRWSGVASRRSRSTRRGADEGRLDRAQTRQIRRRRSQTPQGSRAYPHHYWAPSSSRRRRSRGRRTSPSPVGEDGCDARAKTSRRRATARAHPRGAARHGATCRPVSLPSTNGRPAEAIVQFRKSSKGNPDPLRRHLQLASALDAAGKPPEARPLWGSAPDGGRPARTSKRRQGRVPGCTHPIGPADPGLRALSTQRADDLGERPAAYSACSIVISGRAAERSTRSQARSAWGKLPGAYPREA